MNCLIESKFRADSAPSTNNALQQMVSMSLNSDHNSEWSGEPSAPCREYPKAYVESAGGTYEEFVWVLERLRGAAGNIECK